MEEAARRCSKEGYPGLLKHPCRTMFATSLAGLNKTYVRQRLFRLCRRPQQNLLFAAVDLIRSHPDGTIHKRHVVACRGAAIHHRVPRTGRVDRITGSRAYCLVSPHGVQKDFTQLQYTGPCLLFLSLRLVFCSACLCFSFLSAFRQGTLCCIALSNRPSLFCLCSVLLFLRSLPDVAAIFLSPRFIWPVLRTMPAPRPSRRR